MGMTYTFLKQAAKSHTLGRSEAREATTRTKPSSIFVGRDVDTTHAFKESAASSTNQVCKLHV